MSPESTEATKLASGNASKAVFQRQLTTAEQASDHFSSRRKKGALWMSCIALAALVSLRSTADVFYILLVEFGGIAAFLLLLSRIRTRLDAIQTLFLAAGISCSLPWVFDPLWRSVCNCGNGSEILVLCSMVWGSLSLALFGTTVKHLSLAVVTSGFLTLFTTFISDQMSVAIYAYAWGILCLWWLVSNQWELVESCQASQVTQATLPVRWRGVLLGVAVFGIAVTLSYKRLPVLHKLKDGFMPSSGGTKWSDSAARSGIGSGDALVAAQQHAMTFGAVDTDFFLDSPKQSLFDVFSDEFGEPVVKKEMGRAQALSPEDVRSDEGKFAEANRASGNKFSTQRDTPRLSETPDDLFSDALMFWKGRPGIRLAVDRLENFDGVEWHKDEEQSAVETPKSVLIGEQMWFKPRSRLVRSSVSPFIGAVPEALKFTRYGSAIVPTRSGTQLWSIDMLDRADFFAFSKDDCLSMTGRESVPEYTVLRFVNSSIDYQQLVSLMASCAQGEPYFEKSDLCHSHVAKLAHQYVGNSKRGWYQVQRVVDGIRRDFELSREISYSGEDPVSEFLEKKKGPSYLIATSAALMLEHLGYKVRLARGFYVNPENSKEGEYAILASNAHVWLEINVGHGYWIPLEPSPTFQQPRYVATLAFRIYEARYAILIGLAAFTGLAILVYRFRFWLFEFLCRIGWYFVSVLGDRRRIRWLVKVLDWRSALIGKKRMAGRLPERQINALGVGATSELGQDARLLFSEADKLWFGHADSLSSEGRQALNRLWTRLSVFEIRKSLASSCE